MMKLKALSLLRLQPILNDIVLAVWGYFSIDIITDIYRKGMVGRHIDLRCWDDDLGERAAKWVNDRWEYDYKRPQKPVALYHDSGSGWHLHLQVHPNTRKRKEIKS